ncbi:MAG: hypothetical protein ABF811_05715 [Pseudoclavibacter sp.]|jgi:hypothetical protein
MLRSGHHSRHRELRSLVNGPDLPPAEDRVTVFADQVQDISEYLVGLWPDELKHVRVAIDGIPDPRRFGGDNPYWSILPDEALLVFHRLPIQRSAAMRRADPETQRMLIEYHVYRAFAAYLGREPWELSPRHRF